MLRVGIVGAGRIGAKRARVVAHSDQTELVVVADSDIERARGLAEEFGCKATDKWRELVSSRAVDIVVVATPHNWLAPIALAALNAQKHVLCEKPLAMNPAEASALVESAERNGRKLKTGFNHRYHPGLQQAQALAQGGHIGRILFIRCRYGHGGRAGYEQEWRADPEQSGGGELMDQGIHAFDLFRWFLGEFREIYAVFPQAFWPMPVEDNAFCTLRTASGQVATLHASWTQWKNLFSFEVFGEEGYLIVEGLGGSYGPETLIVGRRPRQFGIPEEQRIEYPGEDCSWAQEWKDFIAAIREDRRPIADGYDGWQALRLVQAAYESVRREQPVRLE